MTGFEKSAHTLNSFRKCFPIFLHDVLVVVANDWLIASKYFI